MSIAKPVVSKNLDWNDEAQLWNRKVSGLPTTDAPPGSAREWNERVLVPFTHDSFRFECVWILPISCYAAPCKRFDQTLGRAVLTIIMNSRDADAEHGPSRNWERHRLSGFISNVEGGVLGAILRGDRCLG